VAVGADMTSSITGIPSQSVENVSVSDVRIVMDGGGTAKQAEAEVPERESAYPAGRMFGQLPACGFYLRHARGVVLRNVSVSSEKPDERPALVADDVAGLSLDGFRGANPVRLKNVRGATVRAGAERVKISGARSEQIVVIPERAAGDAEIVERAADVRPDAVRVLGGR